MWNVYNTWDWKDNTKESIINFANQLKFRPDIVERTIGLYDSIYQLMKAEVKQTFYGGSMINQVYINPDEARLSIDIDSVIREEIQNKRDLLDVLVNLRETMLSDKSLIPITIKDLEIGIGEILSDTKRQALHPQVLFLKRILPTFFVGTPLPDYLSRIGLSSKDPSVARYLINLKKEFGFLPRIYELRIEIRFSKEGISYPFHKQQIFPYFKQVLTPIKYLECDIEQVASVAQGKLEFLELVNEEETINITNTICDLRILYLYNLDIEIPLSIRNKIKRIKEQCKADFSKYWFYQLISTKYSFDGILSKIFQINKAKKSRKEV
ncbi:MAG TPA: hypothetical protein VMV49_04940 [Candidatus Deferrimicrobium sp.]|nr:hypothetical protein [Candidatus Deferrimicrobium sp.]